MVPPAIEHNPLSVHYAVPWESELEQEYHIHTSQIYVSHAKDPERESSISGSFHLCFVSMHACVNCMYVKRLAYLNVIAIHIKHRYC